MKDKKYILPFLCITLCAFLSCIDDNSLPITEEEGDATVQLTLTMPATNGLDKTRSISETPGEENQINTIDVLAFVKNSGGDWVYDYAATNIQKSISGNSMKVTATVKAMSAQQVFVVLANSTSELGAAAPFRYEKMDAIERRIVSGTGNGEWPARINGTGPFTPFPMYARTNAQIVDPATNNIGTYQMIRMVARIDVALDASVNNFELKQACLFNYMKAGYVSYGESGFSTALAMATVPAVPAVGYNSGTPILLPTVHYEADNSLYANGRIECAIYTFESEAIATESEKTKKTALVIGGFYNGSSTMTWYRIDLKTTTDIVPTNISSGILRNHLYKVNVQHVSGEGYPTDEEAYLGSSRITAEVVDWNAAAQNVITDGQFHLKTELDSDMFHAAGGTLTLKAETDYNINSQGFSAGIWIEDGEITYTPAVNSGDEWIRLTNIYGTNGSLTRTVGITAMVNASKANRSAKVYVKAGNLTNVIEIIQKGN